jgi:hypothetical protein
VTPHFCWDESKRIYFEQRVDQMILEGIPFDSGMETLRLALPKILKRKAERALPSPWSYVDLQPAEVDSGWLQCWARCLEASTIREAERRDACGDKGISADGLLYDWQASLGLLLLFAGADCGRQRAASKEIWPTVQAIFMGKGVQSALFQNGSASHSSFR